MLAALMLAVAAPSPVVVSALQSEQLARACSGKDDDTSASFCTGYILGVFDALSLAKQICPSAKKASTRQVVTAVRKALRRDPDHWSSAPSFLVRDALQQAFPCKRK